MAPKWRVLGVLSLVPVLGCSDSTSVGEMAHPWGLRDLGPSLAVIPSLPPTCGPSTLTTLIADETVPVGTVEVSSDEDHLYVAYRTSAAWPILTTALFVGDSPNGIPLSGGGNPRVGKFPYKSSHRDEPREVIWEIPRAVIVGPTAVIAAFAQVGASVEEGAWGEGPLISSGGNWSMYFTHEMGNCAVETVGQTGGAVTTPDGTAGILIPAGALPGPTIISIQPATAQDVLDHIASRGPAPTPAGAADSTSPAGEQSPSSPLPTIMGLTPIAKTIWDFGPDGTEFGIPSTVTLSYDEANLPVGVAESELGVFVINGVFPYRDLPSTVDAWANTVTAEIDHFSYVFIAVIESRDVDLEVNELFLSASSTPAKVGRPLDFQSTVRNLGPDDSRGGTLRYSAYGDVALSAVFGACSEEENPLFADVEVVCEVDPLIVGAMDGVPAFQLAAQSVGDVEVWAAVSPAGRDEDDVPENNRMELVVSVQPAILADLTVSALAESADPIELGQAVEYTATVRNLGPDDVSDATAYYIGFGDVTLGSLSQGCAEIYPPLVGQAEVRCSVGSLASGETAEAPSATFVPGRTGTFTVWSSPGSEGSDPNQDNNRHQESFTVGVPVADLGIDTFFDAPDPAEVGENIVYSIQVSADPGTLQPVVGAQLLLRPSGAASFISSTNESCFETITGVTCPLPTLQPGLVYGMDVAMAPGAGVTELAVLATLQAPFGTSDPVASNNIATQTTTIGSAGTADLSVTALSESADPIQLGESVTYQATLTNYGPHDITDAVVYYQMFGNAVAGPLNPACTETPAPALADVEIVCTVGALGNQDLTLVPWASFTPQSSGDFTIWASPGSSATDPNTGNNRYEATLTVDAPQADLRVDRIAGNPDPVPVGGTVTYEVDVIAMGASQPVNGPVLRILFTGDAVLQSSTASCSDIVGGIACPLGTLQPGLLKTVQVAMTLGTAGQTVSAEATVVVPANVSDPDLSNNSRTETTVVGPAAPRVIAMGEVAQGVLPPPGDTALYLFDGTAGQWVRIHMSLPDAVAGEWGQLILFGPGGDELYPASIPRGRATELSSANLVLQLPATGTYRVGATGVSVPYRLGLGTGEGRLDPSYGPSGSGVVAGPRASTPGNPFLQMELVGDDVVTIGERRLTRFDASGLPAGGFGSAGAVDLATATGTSWLAYAMRIQPDGKIVVAGRSGASPYPWIVARFQPNGALDPTFGTGGWTTVNLGGNRSTAKPLGIRFFSNGGELDIVVAGNAGALQEQIGIIRLDPDGSLDGAFGTGGIVFENGGFAPDYMSLQSDGKILMGDEDQLRRYTAAGARDASFGVDGLLGIGFGGAARNLVVMPDDHLMLLGDDSGDTSILRLTPGGALDGSFAGGGYATYDFGISERFQSLTQDASGNLIVVGHQRTSGGDYEFLVTRMSANGALDPSFGVSGYTLETRVDEARAVAIDSQGRILVGGQEMGSIHGIQLTRHLPR